MTVQEKLQEISEKRSRVTELYGELEVSLAIQEIWPEAFDVSPTTAYLGGTFKRPLVVLKRGDGERMDWPVKVDRAAPGGLPVKISSEEVPRVLLDDVLKHFLDPYLKSGYHKDAQGMIRLRG